MAFSSLRVGCLTLALCLSIFSASALDAQSARGKVIPVAFGPGLNTLPAAGPSGPENHHVIPKEIRIDAGDVISFAIAGFHQIRIFQPGVTFEDVQFLLPPECRSNPVPASCAAAGLNPIPLDSATDFDTIPDLPTFYEGLTPIIAPLPVTVSLATGAGQATLPTRPSVQNRVETVLFDTPGRYLAICTILPHFNDRMIAWVEVRRRSIWDRD
jgi:hypothetical protein